MDSASAPTARRSRATRRVARCQVRRRGPLRAAASGLTVLHALSPESSSAAGAALYRFIAAAISFAREQLGGIGRPLHRRVNLRLLVRRESAPAHDCPARPTVAASDAHAQSRKLDRAQLLDDRLQPVVPAGRPARRTRKRPSGRSASSTTTSTSAASSLWNARDLPHRPAAQVHERRRLGQQHRRRRSLRLSTSAAFHFASLATSTRSAAQALGHLKPDVVARVAYSRPGIAETTISFTANELISDQSPRGLLLVFSPLRCLPLPSCPS